MLSLDCWKGGSYAFRFFSSLVTNFLTIHINCHACIRVWIETRHAGDLGTACWCLQ